MKVLIADDTQNDIQNISSMLSDYDLLFAYDGHEALEAVRKTPGINLIILGVNLARANSFDLLRAIKESPIHSKISILVLTNHEDDDSDICSLDIGSLDFICKPLKSITLRKRVELHCDLINAHRLLDQQDHHIDNVVQERLHDYVLSRDITIQALVGLLEIRNIESSFHTHRTQLMMQALCEQMRYRDAFHDILTPEMIAELISTVPLHDIGKVGIPDSILLKPGKLSDDEFEIMKRHTTYGVAALEDGVNDGKKPSFINTAIDIVGTHHEKYDGTGYPSGLKGKDIPLAGRMMAIVDVYDALVNQRVYKTAFPHELAMEIINKESGRHFDPEIVTVFSNIVYQIQSIQRKFAQP